VSLPGLVELWLVSSALQLQNVGTHSAAVGGGVSVATTRAGEQPNHRLLL
jgi:hypothetical protein